MKTRWAKTFLDFYRTWCKYSRVFRNDHFISLERCVKFHIFSYFLYFLQSYAGVFCILLSHNLQTENKLGKYIPYIVKTYFGISNPPVRLAKFAIGGILLIQRFMNVILMVPPLDGSLGSDALVESISMVSSQQITQHKVQPITPHRSTFLKHTLSLLTMT